MSPTVFLAVGTFAILGGLTLTSRLRLRLAIGGAILLSPGPGGALGPLRGG